MKHPSSIQIVLIVLFVSYLPHVLWLPGWVSVFCCSLWSIRFLSDIKRWPPPGRLYIYGLTLLALTGVIVFRGGAFYGREAGTSLLALMLAVKPFEIRTYRDKMIAVFLTLFLLFTTLLFTQSLVLGIYLFACLVLIMAALIMVNQSRARVRVACSQAGLLCLQALPLAACCFFLFPRLPGALIGLRNLDSPSISGLSETLSPGSLSHLVQSEAIAFRAAFAGSTPERRHLYWRAAVLWDCNGTTWTRGPTVDSPDPEFPFRNARTTYTLTLEPTGKTMLPALDLPLEAPPLASMLEGLTLQAKNKVDKKTHYQVTSTLNSTLPPDPGQIHRGRVLDRSLNPRTQELMQTLSAGTTGPEEVVAKVRAFFRGQNFSYTLSPPRLRSTHLVDEFLFRTRQGYCSHFAQAFAWMMRSAGIPSRIVVGYQGGEENPMGDYLMVRQSDAHAWVEVVLPGKGWSRIDPTQIVAPARIASGMQHLLAQSGQRSLFLIDDDHWLMKIGHRLQLSWDALNYHWYTWVVDYTLAKQNSLLNRLHLGTNVWQSLNRVIMVFTAFVLIFATVLAVMILPARTPATDPAELTYRRFRKKIQKLGVPVFPEEGPRDEGLRFAEQLPRQKKLIQEISDLYIQLRYAGSQDRRLLQKLKKRVASFPRSSSLTNERSSV